MCCVSGRRGADLLWRLSSGLSSDLPGSSTHIHPKVRNRGCLHYLSWSIKVFIILVHTPTSHHIFHYYLNHVIFHSTVDLGNVTGAAAKELNEKMANCLYRWVNGAYNMWKYADWSNRLCIGIILLFENLWLCLVQCFQIVMDNLTIEVKLIEVQQSVTSH